MRPVEDRSRQLGVVQPSRGGGPLELLARRERRGVRGLLLLRVHGERRPGGVGLGLAGAGQRDLPELPGAPRRLTCAFERAGVLELQRAQMGIRRVLAQHLLDRADRLASGRPHLAFGLSPELHHRLGSLDANLRPIAQGAQREDATERFDGELPLSLGLPSWSAPERAHSSRARASSRPSTSWEAGERASHRGSSASTASS